MKALTLWRPWPTAILRFGKRFENRTWAPPVGVMGQLIAIHAGSKIDSHDKWPGPAHWLKAIEDNLPALLGPEQAVVGVARVVGVVRKSNDPWFSGPVGWELADVIQLAEPIQCKGAQGLWTLPSGIAAAVEKAATNAAIQSNEAAHG